MAGPGEPSRSASPKKVLESDIDKERSQKEKKEALNSSLGNFSAYYGRRIEAGEKDPRLALMKKEWFEQKAILDIGCNAGFVTLSIAKDFAPRRILGIDIDPHLVGVARKNIRHYCEPSTELVGKYPATFASGSGTNASLSFSTKFPDNIWFRHEDYVLESDELLEAVKEEFDVILALSITKWIHLNRGDEGIQRFFKRAFRQLRPGGVFILEPQGFESYWKRAKMTPHLKETFRTITFKPDDFEAYLLKEVGFENVTQLGVPKALSKGYARPLAVFQKKAPRFLEKEEGGKSSDDVVPKSKLQEPEAESEAVKKNSKRRVKPVSEDQARCEKKATIFKPDGNDSSPIKTKRKK